MSLLLLQNNYFTNFSNNLSQMTCLHFYYERGWCQLNFLTYLWHRNHFNWRYLKELWSHICPSRVKYISVMTGRWQDARYFLSLKVSNKSAKSFMILSPTLILSFVKRSLIIQSLKVYLVLDKKSWNSYSTTSNLNFSKSCKFKRDYLFVKELLTQLKLETVKFSLTSLTK